MSEPNIIISSEMDAININSDLSENEESSENESPIVTASYSMSNISNVDSASTQSRLNLVTIVRIKEEPEEILPDAADSASSQSLVTILHIKPEPEEIVLPQTNTVQKVINACSDSSEIETTTHKRKSTASTSSEEYSSENENHIKKAKYLVPDVRDADSSTSQSLVTILHIKPEPEEIVLPQTNTVQKVMNVRNDSFEIGTTTHKRKSTACASSEEYSSENENPTKMAKYPMLDVRTADSSSSQSLVTILHIKPEPEEIMLPSESSQGRTSNVASKTALAEDIILDHILKYLAILYNQLIQLTTKFEKISLQLDALVNSEGRIQRQDFTLSDVHMPISTENGLRKLNHKLKMDKDLSISLVHKLTNYSDGKFPRTFISDITQKLVSLKLARQYNRFGRNGKKSFSEFKEIINVIIAATSVKFKKLSREKLLEIFGKVLTIKLTEEERALNSLKRRYSFH